MRILQKYEDRDLIIKLKKGDIKAFEELYYRYNVKLKAFSGTYFKDEVVAEEVVQEVFVKIWERRALLDEDLSFKAYLFQIIKNHIYNIFRKKINEVSYENAPVSNSYNHNPTEELHDLIDLQERTYEVIEKLPHVQKNIFTLSRFEELSNDEISQKLNLSKRTVEHHIYLALKTLKKSLSSSKINLFFFL